MTLEGFLANVFEIAIASVLASLLLTVIGIAIREMGPSVRWILTPPVYVSGRGLQVQCSGEPVEILAEFTCMLRYTRLIGARSTAGGKFVWKLPGNTVRVDVLARHRCDSLKACCRADGVAVSFDDLHRGAGAIIRVLCRLDYRGYGRMEDVSDGLNIAGPIGIRVPRWGSLASVVGAILAAPTVYNYAYVGSDYSGMVAWLIMLAVPGIVIGFFSVHYRAIYWLHYWLFLRKKVPPSELLRRRT